MSGVSVPGGVDADVHVQRQDQAKINRFARLNAKLCDTQAEIKEKKSIIENVEDAGDELMMLDVDEDDGGVPFMVADAFFYTSSDDASHRLEQLKKSLSSEVDALNTQCSDYTQQMAVLKRELYAKFGDNINLEPSDED